MQFKLLESPLGTRSGSGAAGAELERQLLDRQQAFGFTQEDIQFFLEPMAQHGDNPLGSMAATAYRRCSRASRSVYNYFKQNFAQVTNPPIDPIREELAHVRWRR